MTEPVDLAKAYTALKSEHEELVAMMGDEIGPCPDAGIDAFLSHFIMCIEFLEGAAAGEVVTLTMPPALQTVARSDPFVYRGRKKAHEIKVPLPDACTLPTTIKESDFLERPSEFFQPGKETVWMQILNLDARAETEELGTIRIILGETLKRDYPDMFQPSLGGAQSLGRGGFPVRLFFNPYAVIETPLGSFRAIHGTLAYGRVTRFPPTGTPITITDMVPLEPTEEVVKTQSYRQVNTDIKPFARLLALSHPIDVALQVPGEDAYNLVERRIARAM